MERSFVGGLWANSGEFKVCEVMSSINITWQCLLSLIESNSTVNTK